MTELNIKNIIYSSDDGSLVKMRLKDYKPKVVSLGRQFILNGCKEITRDKLQFRKINYCSDSSSCGDSDIDDDANTVSTSSTGSSYSRDDDMSSVISGSSSKSSFSSKLRAEIPNIESSTTESILSYANKLMHKSKMINV